MAGLTPFPFAPKATDYESALRLNMTQNEAAWADSKRMIVSPTFYYLRNSLVYSIFDLNKKKRPTDSR